MRAATLSLVLLMLAVPALAQDDVTVAVLDTGVDPEHPELQGRVSRMSFVQALPDLPGQDAVPDHDGRGTGVASLVAGTTLGAASEVRILDLQVVPVQTGTDIDPRTEDAAQRALDWVLRQDDPPGVVLLSFAEAGLTPEGAETLAAQAQRLFEAGILPVAAAAGPSALHDDAHVLTVAGAETCAGGSQGSDGPLKPDVVAPAEGVEVADRTAPLGGGGTRAAAGTAYAAAHTAGVAAAVMQARPDIPVDAVAAILRDSALLGDDGPTGATAPGPCQGWGVVDREAALDAAAAWQDPFTAGGGRGTPMTPPGVVVLALAGALLVARRARGHD